MPFTKDRNPALLEDLVQDKRKLESLIKVLNALNYQVVKTQNYHGFDVTLKEEGRKEHD
jgi:hypothetical protein